MGRSIAAPEDRYDAGQGNQDPRSILAPHLGGMRVNQASLLNLPRIGELAVNNWTVYYGPALMPRPAHQCLQLAHNSSVRE